MNHQFKDKRISAILSILPPKIVRYEDELEDYPFPIKQSQMLGKMMNYHTRREIDAADGLSDYALFGLEHMLADGILHKEEIDAIVVVSSSQDYIMPSVSYILQGKLGLNNDVHCVDILQVCGGYAYGLMQCFMLIDTMGYKKAVLVTGDTLTKKIGKHDRNSRPIIGDCINISIIEQCDGNGPIFMAYKITNGTYI